MVMMSRLQGVAALVALGSRRWVRLVKSESESSDSRIYQNEKLGLMFIN